MNERRGDLGAMTVEEYLAFEYASMARHEFVGGRVYAMSGATARHNRIVANIHSRLRAATRTGECDAYFIDLKVRVARDRIYYPDAVVVCESHETDGLIFDEPWLVVEVTSRSTQRIDRGEKLDAYLGISSLRGYLIAEQGRRRVTLYSRELDGEWVRDEVIGSGVLQLPCVDATLTLDEVYENVQLPALAVHGTADDDGPWADEDELGSY